MKATLAILFFSMMLTACQNSGNNSNTEGKGDEGLGGGSVDAQAVQVLVSEVVRKVESMPEVFPEVNVQELNQVASKVEIIGRKRTYANGVETNATNDGLGRIEVNMTRWARLQNPNKKIALIFHELLGILKLEKNNYAISSRMLYESRFGAQRTYNCKTPAGQSCQIVMAYDSSQKAFRVFDKDCGQFPRSDTKFWQNQSTYSSTSACPYSDDIIEDESAGPSVAKTCMSTSSSGVSWDYLEFHDGYAFHFGGVQSSQLDCQL